MDLLSETELAQVQAFIEGKLQQHFESAIQVFRFSCRTDTDRWRSLLCEAVFRPLAENVPQTLESALTLKLNSLSRACRDYLTVGLRAAELADADRNRLSAAILNEEVTLGVTKDELRLAAQHVSSNSRPAFERLFFADRSAIEARLASSLAADALTWRGNLAMQAAQYKDWSQQRLLAELSPLSESASTLAMDLLGRVETRFRRILEASRDRLSRNIRANMGVSLSPVAWEIALPELERVPITLGQTFMIHWDLLWWALPMWLVGGLFRRHIRGRLSFELDKNLYRLTSSWTEISQAAIAELQQEANGWVERELIMINQLLSQQPDDANRFREGMESLPGLDHSDYKR